MKAQTSERFWSEDIKSRVKTLIRIQERGGISKGELGKCQLVALQAPCAVGRKHVLFAWRWGSSNSPMSNFLSDESAYNLIPLLYYNCSRTFLLLWLSALFVFPISFVSVYEKPTARHCTERFRWTSDYVTHLKILKQYSIRKFSQLDHQEANAKRNGEATLTSNSKLYSTPSASYMQKVNFDQRINYQSTHTLYLSTVSWLFSIVEWNLLIMLFNFSTMATNTESRVPTNEFLLHFSFYLYLGKKRNFRKCSFCTSFPSVIKGFVPFSRVFFVFQFTDDA